MAADNKKEFWRWTESNWKNPDVDWKAAQYITIGIDVGSVSSQAVSSTCVVYAKSEAMGLLRKGWTQEEVLAAYCKAMADRIYSLVDRVGVKPEFAVTGGMAKNRGVMDRLMSMIGMERMKTEWDTQIAGAAGAAMFGFALCQRGKGRKK